MLTWYQNMMVVCKDRLDRILSSERIGFEAAAAVESDISALLAGKTYDDLSALQRRIQEKLTSGEPVDTDYWEGLLKKLLVWKSKVHTSTYTRTTYSPTARPSLKASMKLLFATGLNNLGKDSETKHCKLRKNFLLASLEMRQQERPLMLRQAKRSRKSLLQRIWKYTTAQ